MCIIMPGKYLILDAQKFSVRQTSDQLLIKSWEISKVMARSKYEIVEQKMMNLFHPF